MNSTNYNKGNSKTKAVSVSGTYFIWFALFLCTLACAPTHFVKPLKKNESAVGVTAGGPLIDYSGTTIPMPLTSIQYGYGLSNKTTAFGSIYPTSLLYGVFQTDFGICSQLHYFNNIHLGLSASPSLNLALDRWKEKLKVWPQVDINAYWEFLPERSLCYIGINNWFELTSRRAHGETQSQHWLVNPQLGIRHATQHWQYCIEAKYLLPWQQNTPNIVEYKGINGKGAIGIYIGICRKFN